MNVPATLSRLRKLYSGQRMPADPLLDILDQMARDLYGSDSGPMPQVGLRDAAVALHELISRAESRAIGAGLAVEAHSEALQDLNARLQTLERKAPP